MKLTTTTKDITAAPKKYVRLRLTEDNKDWHRLIEHADGTVEYVLGAGKWKEITPRTFITLLRSIVQAVKSHQIEYLAVQLQNSPFPLLHKHHDDAWITSTMAENFLLAAYEFTKYKSKDSKRKQLQEILVCGGMTAVETAGFTRGQIVATAANVTRDIANTAASDMTPSKLAEAAKQALKGKQVTVRVLGEKELKKLGMGALLAVGQGTKHETKFIIAEYWGLKKPGKKVTEAERPIVLIGKGVTYDTGGLNVKPSGSMHDMHLDMSGGAAVIGAMKAIVDLKLQKNVVMLIPTAENAISDDSMRAGDIVTSMSGQTIEVVHTDAEGRMILADALTYSARYQPKVILDVATLTGAALVALGQHANAILTKDETLQKTLQTLGEVSGDYVWPLPLWDEYKQHIKSDRADLSNIAPNFSRFGGTIEGGTFLSFFAPQNTPWAHIDIAPRMSAIPSDKLTKGSTGEPVRLLVRFVEHA